MMLLLVIRRSALKSTFNLGSSSFACRGTSGGALSPFRLRINLDSGRQFSTSSIILQSIQKEEGIQAEKLTKYPISNKRKEYEDEAFLSTPLRKLLGISRIKKDELIEEEKQKESQDRKSFKENMKTIFRIIKLGRRDLRLFLYALAFILCAVLYPTASVKLVGSSIDAINQNIKDDEGNLLIWGYNAQTVFAVMVPFMCVSAVCFWARIWVLKVLGERLVARLRLRAMKQLVRHDSKFYDSEKHKVGDLISRLSSDAYVVSRSITSNLPDGLKNVLFGIMSAYMMFSINPLLFGVMLCISPPITFGSVWYGEKIRGLSTKLQNASAGLTKAAEETLSSVKLIQAFTGEQKELAKYSNELRNVVNVAKTEALAQSNYLVSIYSLYHTGYLSCIALGVYLILQGQMTTGDVVAFTMYLEFFNLALYSLTTTYIELMKGSGAGVKLFDLIDYKNDVENIKGQKLSKDGLPSSEVEFKNVTFSYPTRKNHKIFDDCSFTIPAASSTCIVAPSGAGKSTVALLLLRSYNLQSGEILIGGKDIKDIQTRELRRNIIGIVQQEPVLLSGTILENIIYGLTPLQINNLTMKDVIEAAKQANCHGFISNFPDGYDTIIGARGASLSGGQKQRVAIARALIKKPLVLILDEATSALDSKLESLINETLKELTSQGKITIISIAHRLSTISKSENVVVLGKRGKAVECGTFVELYSNPKSELSKLLDSTSSNMRKNDEGNSEEVSSTKSTSSTESSSDSAPVFNEDDELLRVRSIIEDLPFELRQQLIQQITEQIESDRKAAVKEVQVIPDNLS